MILELWEPEDVGLTATDHRGNGQQAENVDVTHLLREEKDLWICKDSGRMSSTHSK